MFGLLSDHNVALPVTPACRQVTFGLLSDHNVTPRHAGMPPSDVGRDYCGQRHFGLLQAAPERRSRTPHPPAGRDGGLICVVEAPGDVIPIERRGPQTSGSPA